MRKAAVESGAGRDARGDSMLRQQNNELSFSMSLYSHSTKDINLPVLPPILLIVLLNPCPARLNPELADDVTLDNPCEACEVALLAVSFALEAVSEAAFAAFDVVDACRKAICRSIRCCGRRSRRRVADVAGIF